MTRVGVLPCNTPPAISLTVQGANGTVLFSRAIDRTQQVPLVGGASLLVVVNQLPNATIGFQVYMCGGVCEVCVCDGVCVVVCVFV